MSPQSGASGTTPGAVAQNSGGVPANIVTDEMVSKTPANSPSRALLEWWQAVQFRDVGATESLTSAPTVRRITTTRLRQMVLRIGDNLPGVRVGKTRREGGSSIIRSFLVFAGSDGRPDTLSPRSFALRLEGGNWKLSSVEYLAQAYQAALAADRKAPPKGGPSSGRGTARGSGGASQTATTAP